MPRRILAAFLLLASCLSTDLPTGWDDAEPIEVFTQSACAGDPYENTDERMEATGSADTIAVDYLEAHFRCEQDVEGYALVGDGTLDILVQPKDMNPSSVANCDCLYDIEASVSGLAAGPWEVTVYRRWDNMNDPNDPLVIGSQQVEVTGR